MEDTTAAALLNAYTAITSTEINAWTMYVVATFAAAGFGFTSAKSVSWVIALAATIGFLAFTFGQYVIVCDLITQREAILNILKASSSPQIKSLIPTLTKSGLTVQGAFMTHVFVDSCVVIIMMFYSISRLWEKYCPKGHSAY